MIAAPISPEQSHLARMSESHKRPFMRSSGWRSAKPRQIPRLTQAVARPVARRDALSVQSVVNPDDIQASIDNIHRFVDAGVTHIVLNLRPPYPERIVPRLAEQVIPKIKG